MEVKYTLGLLVCIVASAFCYEYAVFENEIIPKCLDKLWSSPGGTLRPLGLTMDSFISLVEKVEMQRPRWDVYTMSRALLKRFAFEEMEFKILGSGQRVASLSDDYKIRWKVMDQLVGKEEGQRFHEEDLNDLEKCTMFFMMGHLVNTTFREGIDIEAESVVPEVSEHVYRSPAQGKVPKNPREQGVVMVKGRAHHAVAVGKILNAIIAGQHNKEINLSDLEKRFPQDLKIKARIGVTMADVISLAAIHHDAGKTGLEFFGPGGEWKSKVCPDEYRLRENATGSTNALLRGAVDGALISLALEKIKGTMKEQDISLSRLLRMYYSKEGIAGSDESPYNGYSFCRRGQISFDAQEEIIESSRAFYHAHYFEETGQEDKNRDENVKKAYDHASTAISRMADQDRDDCEQNTKFIHDGTNPQCETPSNLVVVLDSSEMRTDGYSEQEAIVGHLSNHLAFGVGAGSLSVYLDIKGDRKDELMSIYHNATNPTCATCNMEWTDQKHFGRGPNTAAATLTALNHTLENFYHHTDRLPGVPSKVVVLFRYAEANDKAEIKKAKEALRRSHRESRLLVVGNKMDTLKEIAFSESHIVSLTDRPEATAKLLAEKICTVPAVLQDYECGKMSQSKEKNILYKGSVSIGHVQYWSMYPEYFHKSSNVVFTFKATTGQITVCEGRGDASPLLEGEKSKCKNDNDGNELIFSYKEPCGKTGLDNCQPINFAIIGMNTPQIAFDCPAGDHQCRRLDQRRFTVSHKGVSCSGCEFLKSSPLVILFFALTYLCLKHN